MKLHWELTRPIPKLWASFLLQKYVPRGDVLKPNFKRKGSHTWNAVVPSWNVLQSGFGVRLGRGDVSFWFGNWHTEGPLCNQVPYIHISDSHLMVKDGWRNAKWELLLTR